MLITFKGYLGNGNAEPKENAAAHLTVGKQYVAKGGWFCEDDDSCRGCCIALINDVGTVTVCVRSEAEEVA